MPYDESSITGVSKSFYGPEMRLGWTSTAPAGTPFQAYVDGLLQYHGTARKCSVPRPPPGVVRVNVGTVAAGEESVDFSGELPGFVRRRARLDWLGGTYLDPTGGDDVAGFHVYGEATPGGGVGYARPLASIPAYRDGVITDGWGLGGWGQGGWGKSASSYSWTSPPLYSGRWTFAVKSFDAAGNEAAPGLIVVPIAVPPRPPAFYPDRRRLHHTWDQQTHVIDLTWQASPDA